MAAQPESYLADLQRLQADFQNYRRRAAADLEAASTRAIARVVTGLLPALDALDLAIEHLTNRTEGTRSATASPGAPTMPDSRAVAITAISELFRRALGEEGVVRTDPLGDRFDPTVHEAVGYYPASPDLLPDTDGPGRTAEPTGPSAPRITRVVRPGYVAAGIVIRPATVLIAE